MGGGIMQSSLELFQSLPSHLLRIGDKQWKRLGYELQLLLVALAKNQNFKCALCDQDHSLEIERDRNPEYGTGDDPTIFNTRGLACPGCSQQITTYERVGGRAWHTMMNAKEEKKGCVASDGFVCRITHRQYWDYIGSYEGRAAPLIEAAWETQLGTDNYRRRRDLLEKFDDWKKGWFEFPWQWRFEEIKQKRKRHAKTGKPWQFVRGLTALGPLAELGKQNSGHAAYAKVIDSSITLNSFVEGIRRTLYAFLRELAGTGEKQKPL
jgi:hypothetical protein